MVEMEELFVWLFVRILLMCLLDGISCVGSLDCEAVDITRRRRRRLRRCATRPSCVVTCRRRCGAASGRNCGRKTAGGRGGEGGGGGEREGEGERGRYAKEVKLKGGRAEERRRKLMRHSRALLVCIYFSLMSNTTRARSAHAHGHLIIIIFYIFTKLSYNFPQNIKTYK